MPNNGGRQASYGIRSNWGNFDCLREIFSFVDLSLINSPVKLKLPVFVYVLQSLKNIFDQIKIHPRSSFFSLLYKAKIMPVSNYDFLNTYCKTR